MITASWKDIQNKTYDILIHDDVDIIAISTDSILCNVTGDHDTYETYVNNNATVYKDNDIDEANWYCTCPWGEYVNTGKRPHDGQFSSGSVKVYDRFCSHAYAAYLMLQTYRKVHKEKNKQYEEDIDNENEINEDDRNTDNDIDSEHDKEQYDELSDELADKAADSIETND